MLLALVYLKIGGAEVSIHAIIATVAGKTFHFAAGATLHTENSHKYGLRDARLLLRAAGWGVVDEWTDDAGQFALVLAEAEAPRFAP